MRFELIAKWLLLTTLADDWRWINNGYSGRDSDPPERMWICSDKSSALIKNDCSERGS
jgi:hypothetical protein